MARLPRNCMRGTVAAVVLLVGACTTTETSRADLESQARTALKQLYDRIPAAQAVSDKSEAVLVFPSVTQAGLGFGGQYGRGVMLKGGQPVGYYNITGGSFGLQAGAQTFSQAYFFTTPRALETFQKTRGFEVGVGLDVAVASAGASGDVSSSTLQKPLVAFVWGQQGLMAGVKVEGQKITELREKN